MNVSHEEERRSGDKTIHREARAVSTVSMKWYRVAEGEGSECKANSVWEEEERGSVQLLRKLLTYVHPCCKRGMTKS